MLSQRFDAINGWLKFNVRFDVESVQVLSMNIHPKMTVKDTINVDHGNYHKDKHRPEQMSPEVIFLKEKIDDPFHCI